MPTQQPLDFFQQTGELDGLGVVISATGLESFFLVAGHRVGRQSDDGNGLGGGHRLDLLRRLPAVQHRQVQVHQDQVRQFTLGDGDPVAATDDNHLVTLPLQPARQHVAAHLVVFDEQDLRHGPLADLRQDAVKSRICRINSSLEDVKYVPGDNQVHETQSITSPFVIASAAADSPEPTSISLMLAGIGGLAGYRLTRRIRR